MNHDIIKRVIADQLDIIKDETIIDRPKYAFEENAPYVLIGVRRCGKSTLLHKRVRDLVSFGYEESQIVYVNFEDERLAEFTVSDFDDIVEVAHERNSGKIFYFFDEMQNVDGWERFARRLADAHETVYITGSNAKMLSREIEEKLGGRYLTMRIEPYDFREYLTASNVDFGDSAKSKGLANRALGDYFAFGGLPATLLYRNKGEYLKSVYDKILLNDIVLHHSLRNEQSVKVMIKKMAESVKDELSYSRLHHILAAVGFQLSKATVIDYVSYALQSFLAFRLSNYYSSFVEKESVPKYYFQDNGLLSLFLVDKDTRLLENVVAVELYRRYRGELYFIKSAKTKIDVDFFVPGKEAVQVCYDISDEATLKREVDSLLKLCREQRDLRLRIVTKEAKTSIVIGDVEIDVVDLSTFLLEKKKN